MTFFTIDPPEGYLNDRPEEPAAEPVQNRCHCGRFMPKNGRCSLEIRVYRYGTFAGWEHY